jgi:hyperosmotically inducible periplasmic protein
MRLIRTLLILIIGIVAGVLIADYWSVDIATLGRAPIVSDSERAAARDRGAELTREAAAKGREAANQLENAMSDGALTAKIKSKMALDDNVNARNINVDTSNAVVTLKGTVGSEAERERAVRLAKETRGVTRVDDQLQIKPE